MRRGRKHNIRSWNGREVTKSDAGADRRVVRRSIGPRTELSQPRRFARCQTSSVGVMPSRLIAFCFDANDPRRLARFWAMALRWKIDDESDGRW